MQIEKKSKNIKIMTKTEMKQKSKKFKNIK